MDRYQGYKIIKLCFDNLYIEVPFRNNAFIFQIPLPGAGIFNLKEIIGESFDPREMKIRFGNRGISDLTKEEREIYFEENKLLHCSPIIDYLQMDDGIPSLANVVAHNENIATVREYQIAVWEKACSYLVENSSQLNGDIKTDEFEILGSADNSFLEYLDKATSSYKTRLFPSRIFKQGAKNRTRAQSIAFEEAYNDVHKLLSDRSKSIIEKLNKITSYTARASSIAERYSYMHRDAIERLAKNIAFDNHEWKGVPDERTKLIMEVLEKNQREVMEQVGQSKQAVKRRAPSARCSSP